MIGRHVRTRAGVFGAILRTRATLEEEAAIEKRSLELLDYVGIAARANDVARQLPYGDQRRLEIARALATEPKLLALDEPAAGMNATETLELEKLLQRVRADGTTILLIEHDMKLVMRRLRPGAGARLRPQDRRRPAARGSARPARDRGLSRRRGCRGSFDGMTLLELRRLEVAYGGIKAVKGIDLSVPKGELVCLIGTNGAGKTTTLKAIAGMLPVAADAILYDGAPIGGMRAFELVRRGLALVPEGRGVFGQLTVAENLAMGAYVRSDAAAVKLDMERVFNLFPRLAERRGQSAGTLSGGEQQMLAIGRALMSRPKLLLLDEPSMGLAPLMVQKIFETIRAVAKEGVTILLVEQNARLALEVGSRGYVMETGLITLSGPARELLSDPKVRAAYLGETD